MIWIGYFYLQLSIFLKGLLLEILYVKLVKIISAKDKNDLEYA